MVRQSLFFKPVVVILWHGLILGVSPLLYASGPRTPSEREELQGLSVRAPAMENIAESQATAQGQRNFYRLRPHWKKRLGVERQIWVEADQIDRAGSSSPSLKQFNMRGVGALKVPSERVFRDIQKFDRLSEVSDYFKKVSWNPEKKELYLDMEALGYQAKLVVDVQVLPTEKQIKLFVREGLFSGMQAVIAVEDFEGRDSLIVLSSSLIKRSFSLPDSVVEFGLEALGEKVAQKMRTFLEREYKQHN